MSKLAKQQELLLAALFDWPNASATKTVELETTDNSARGLNAYQANGHFLAQRTLAAAYPVVAQLVGAESLADLSRALWHAHPPTKGDLSLWGAELPEFLANSSQLADEAFLPDVAKAEWALHLCANAPDVPINPSSWVLLTTDDPTSLHLYLAPGIGVVHSRWPVVSILSAHLLGSPTLKEVGAQLRAGDAQETLVWRSDLQPNFRKAMPGESGFLSQLRGGVTLGHALDENQALDFAQWFPMAVQSKLVVGVRSQIPC